MELSNVEPSADMTFWMLGSFAVCLFAFVFLALYVYFSQIYRKFFAWMLNLSSSTYRIKKESNVLIPMSDGVMLAADIYRPKTRLQYPVIILRTPYWKMDADHNYGKIAGIFASQGYVVVVQDVRGKYQSEGVFTPFLHEEKDGKETIVWAAQQKWSDGRVALWGFSYLGSCAWMTTPEAPEALKTIVALFCSQDVYTGWIDLGVPYLKDIIMWLSRHPGRLSNEVSHEEIDGIIKQLPVLQFDKRLKEGLDTFKNWMHHLHEDDYWISLSVAHRRHLIHVPALFIGGWYDRFISNTMDDFIKTISEDPESKSSKSRLMIGPWGHRPNTRYPDIDFGSKAKFTQMFQPMVSWLNCWLKGAASEFDDRYPIDYFMMGANEWRKAQSWPPEETYERHYYLGGSGFANTFSGDGVLNEAVPLEIFEDRYVYNPEDPAPSLGNKMIYGNNTDGPRDQTSLYERKDILFYQSPQLLEEVAIAGPVFVVIYISSSAVDTDFAAKLCDVHPNGKAYFVTNGFIRMRFLDSVKATQGIEPDKIYRVEIKMGHTAYTFLKGHRIQLQISSSDFPNHERNLNTGGSNEGDSDDIKAAQKIYHGGTYDSHLVVRSF